MKCPKCGVELAPHRVEDVAAQRCPSCDGLWVDEEAFRQAKDRAEPNAVWMDVALWKDHERFHVRARELACPGCSKTLVALRYDRTPVEVDYCPTCQGIWLDREEFERVIAALQEELTTLSARELLAEALREAAEIVTGPETLLSEWRDAARVLDLLKLRVLIEKPRLMKMAMELQGLGGPFS